MAKIQYTAIVNDIAGSIRGTTFSRNANGSYIKGKSNPTNPKSPDQMAVRGQLASVSRAWKELTDGQRKGFIDKAATEWTYSDALGQSKQYTGFQLFMKLNQQLATIGQAIPAVVDAPSPVEIPFVAPTVLEATLNAAGDALTLQMDFDGDVNEMGTGIYFTSGTSHSKGRTDSVAFIRKKVSSFDTTNSDSYEIGGSYAATFGLPTVGQKVAVNAWLVDPLTGTKLDLGYLTAVVTQASA